MQRILILGAGKSSTYLISYLLSIAKERDYFVTVCDKSKQAAESAVKNHPYGQAIEFDVNDTVMRRGLIKKADIVINMLTRQFQFQIALDCLNSGVSMLTASYEDAKIHSLSPDAIRKNVLILNEMGLDPGIDHMLAMSLLSEIKQNGGTVQSFHSYGSGLPSKKIDSNPFDYAITWNPRNVLMAGEDGAVYKEEGNIKILPFHRVFDRTWAVPIEEVGYFEAYPNRDSLSYGSILGLEESHTIIRGTLRYPGWSEVWKQIVQLGMTNELLRIPNLAQMTYREFTSMFLPSSADDENMEQVTANYLNINPTGSIMSKLRWLGLFSREKIGKEMKTAAEVMINRIIEKFVLPDGMSDMVILLLEVEAEYPDGSRKLHKRVMVENGSANEYTAISRTVGLPVAVSADLILQNQIQLIGCHIPTLPAIYERVLPALQANGLKYLDTAVEL